jgi:transposase InsO family protein
VKRIYVETYYHSGYSRFMQYINNVMDHPQRKTIEARVKIIEFCDEYGFEATTKAFSYSRSTVYLWKKKLKQSGGKLSALAPGNRAPHKKRTRIVDHFIRSFILNYRTAHPGADKNTITPALTAACKAAGVNSVSQSTVGRIIRDLKDRGLISKATKISINGRDGKLIVREARPAVKKTRRKGFRPKLPGDLVQFDTIALFADGLKRYIFTALDVNTRFAFACTYTTKSSLNGRDFLGKVLRIAPFQVTRIQTDNGGEFQKHFDDYCRQSQLVHFFNYPRHPQSNGHLERFNRTIQEQFAYWHTDKLDVLEDFNRPLMDYLVWYNTEKPHRGIGNKSPLRYYLDNYITSSQQSNMLWTLTAS